MSKNIKYLILVYITLINPLKTSAITVEKDKFDVVPLDYLFEKVEKLKAFQKNLEKVYEVLAICNKILKENKKQNEIFKQIKKELGTELELKKSFFDICKKSVESKKFESVDNNEIEIIKDYLNDDMYNANMNVINYLVRDLKDLLLGSNKIITEFLQISNTNNLQEYINSYTNREVVLRKVVIVDNYHSPVERLNNKIRMELYIGQISILAIIKQIVMDVFTNMLGEDKLAYIIGLIQHELRTTYVLDLMSSIDITNLRNYMFYFIMVAGGINLPKHDDGWEFLEQNYEAMKVLEKPAQLNLDGQSGHGKIDNKKIFTNKYLMKFFFSVQNDYKYNKPVDISKDNTNFKNKNVFLDTTWVLLEDKNKYGDERKKWTSNHAYKELEEIFKTRTLRDSNELDTIGDKTDNETRTREHKKQFMVFYDSNCRSFNGESRRLRI